jgi:hypothetical protein
MPSSGLIGFYRFLSFAIFVSYTLGHEAVTAGPVSGFRCLRACDTSIAAKGGHGFQARGAAGRKDTCDDSSSGEEHYGACDRERVGDRHRENFALQIAAEDVAAGESGG